MIDRYLNARYDLHDGQGNAYNTISKLYTPQFAAKRAYVEALLESDEIFYP